MTAEIIQFGKQRSVGRPVRQSRKRIEAPPIEQTDYEKQARAMVERRRKIKNESEVVRCMVDGGLYEVHFHRGNAWKILTICYRAQNGRIVEIKRGRWSADLRCGRLDPSIVTAARLALTRKNSTPSSRAHETAIAQLWARHARLLRDVEKVKAAIALMERDVG